MSITQQQYLLTNKAMGSISTTRWNFFLYGPRIVHEEAELTLTDLKCCRVKTWCWGWVAQRW